MLEDHADVFAFGPQLAVRHGSQFLVINDDFARCRFFQHIDAADERRFAGTTFPDDAENFAVMDSQ